MSSINDTNTNVVAILSGTSLVYTLYHAYKFDGCKCLVPTKKEWFRALLTWMLVLCSLGMLIWGAGWAYIKYRLGWTYIPSHGAMPYPTVLYTEEYTRLNTPLTFFVCLSYSLQVSLNAEEGLYWWHLMRAVRRPGSKSTSSGKGWFESRFFYAWIIITILTPTAVICAGWIGYKDMDTQMARMFVCGGIIEFLVCLAASTVLVKFPTFLQDVKRSGAGPDVRSRLHFYHEANKVRTFFRFIFTSCVLVLGADGMTKQKRINLNHIAADIIHQISFGAYFFASIVSVLVYLPRTWISAQFAPVLVAQQPLAPPSAFRFADPNKEGETSQALISLLREGGQWDADDDLRAALSTGHGLSPATETRGDVMGWDEGDTRDEMSPKNNAPKRLTVLQNWTSPFANHSTKAIPDLPTELRIHVQQEVHQDGLNPLSRGPSQSQSDTHSQFQSRPQSLSGSSRHKFKHTRI